MDDDLIFECRQCGDCCKGYGGTYVSPEDIQAIATFVGADTDTFVERYCQLSGGKPLLAQGENGYCIFWRDKICSIHPVKPRMCRAWPYLESVLTDIGNWEIMAKACPGIKTTISPHRIREIIAKKIDARKKAKDRF
jgi:Fe-S-cluster containining protein